MKRWGERGDEESHENFDYSVHEPKLYQDWGVAADCMNCSREGGDEGTRGLGRTDNGILPVHEGAGPCCTKAAEDRLPSGYPPWVLVGVVLH